MDVLPVCWGVLIIPIFGSWGINTAPSTQDIQAHSTGGVSSSAISLIKDFEGFSEKAYWDVNAYRAGYGSDTITFEDGTIQKITADSVVTREDAERDLERRAKEFADVARSQVDNFDFLSENVQAAAISFTYNYGQVPPEVRDDLETGDIEAIATAVEGLARHDNGINANRRKKEAEFIRNGG